ncbi:putative N-acyltransferase [Kitasatospora sp. SolWspMP-SS2h]|uniref:GNAT family N-acetyltransferase n=1 Tax=Kitasatospora sp. SolWspMP-SS2h TaxID=1305729 RepID=UPI000DBFE42B|nr:GNAT family N-acetyltransferase [Kitasatospora sp. SolWspMP-SS2h]RAJ38494.1 putative N-acyltransferase [Kitasatospora sp. SolWspMP-SS2h]
MERADAAPAEQSDAAPADRSDAPPAEHADAAPVRLEVLRSIDRLPPGSWERLAPAGDPMWSRSVFRALERSRVGPAGYAYLTVRRGGETVAVLPLCLFPDLRLDRIVGPHERRLLAPLRRLAPRLLRVPMLFCGHLLGQGHVLAAEPLDGPTGRLLVTAVLDFARRERLGTVVFKDFAGPDLAPLRAPLTEAGFFLAPSLPDTELALPIDSFEQYLAALPAKPRRNARAKIRRFGSRPGLRIEVLAAFDHLLPDLLALYGQVMDRADQTLDVLDHAFLAALAADPLSRLVACFEGERLVGFLLCLFTAQPGAGGAESAGGEGGAGGADGTVPGATGARIGLDYRLAHDAALYHNLHYAAVRLAMDTGCRHIRFAQTAYLPKVEMGCALIEQWHAMTHVRPLPRAVLRRLLPPALAAARAQALDPPGGTGPAPRSRTEERPPHAAR